MQTDLTYDKETKQDFKNGYESYQKVAFCIIHTALAFTTNFVYIITSGPSCYPSQIFRKNSIRKITFLANQLKSNETLQIKYKMKYIAPLD